MSGNYPEDEFDNLPDGGPVGVHRKPRSPWRSVFPFLLVLLLVPLLAWGATAIVRNRVSDEQNISAEVAQSEVVQSQSEEIEVVEEEPVELDPETEPTAAPDDPLATDEPGEGEDQGDIAADVDYGTEIAVLNASGIAGFAGSNVELLTAGGFTNAVAGNSSDSVTPANTVYYSGPEHAATAQKVAELLSIDSVVENASATGGTPIVVLLRG